jgi:hypothetical protein
MVQTEATAGQAHHSKCYHCGGEGHWARNCPQKNSGGHHGGKTQGSHQVQVTETTEWRFEERVDVDRKGKGKEKEDEKDVLPNRVEQTGIDQWGDADKKDLVDYLKKKGF